MEISKITSRHIEALDHNLFFSEEREELRKFLTLIVLGKIGTYDKNQYELWPKQRYGDQMMHKEI